MADPARPLLPGSRPEPGHHLGWHASAVFYLDALRLRPLAHLSGVQPAHRRPAATPGGPPGTASCPPGGTHVSRQRVDLISEGTREGLESARARGRVGGRKPKLTARQAGVARGMYDETGGDGKRKYTVAEIAETFGVSRKTVYRHLEPSGGRRQPGKPTRPVTLTRPLAMLPQPDHARASEPAPSPRARPGAAACPSCGHEPATRHEALQQRQDLAVVWLHLDGDYLTEARHCIACQPHEPVIDISCSCCGDGPLITGQPPGLGDGSPRQCWTGCTPAAGNFTPNRYAPPITDSRQHQVT